MIKAGERTNATQFLENAPGAGSAASEQRDAVNDLSLSALVRRWLTTSEAVERQARSSDDDSPLRPTWTPPPEDVRDSVAPLPVLPRRRRGQHPQTTRRLAVLIDVATTPAESADALFELLADQGAVSVCRGYADWTSLEARVWWPALLRQHAIQPYHHFGDGRDHRTLVALAIDAVDLARESAVDVVVLVGDLASAHPLVVRLNASGVRVIAFGTTPTPRDVRELCHEFVDLSGDLEPDNSGKHRA